MASYLLSVLPLVLVWGGLLASGQPTPIQEFESLTGQGPPPCHSKTVTGFRPPRTWASGYHYIGLWGTDPVGESCAREIYVVEGHHDHDLSRALQVFPSLKDLQDKITGQVQHIDLPGNLQATSGNGGVVFNKTYYYFSFSGHPDVSSLLTKADFSAARSPGQRVEVRSRSIPTVEFGPYSYAYEGNRAGVDLVVSETGLFIIYASNVAPHNMTISKLNPATLDFEWTQFLTKSMKSFGNCFIICAKLYCTGSHIDSQTTTTFVYDLYERTEIQQPLPIRNEYQFTAMLDYNPADKKLYGWDRGNLVTYDVNFSQWSERQKSWRVQSRIILRLSGFSFLSSPVVLAFLQLFSSFSHYLCFLQAKLRETVMLLGICHWCTVFCSCYVKLWGYRVSLIRWVYRTLVSGLGSFLLLFFSMGLLFGKEPSRQGRGRSVIFNYVYARPKLLISNVIRCLMVRGRICHSIACPETFIQKRRSNARTFEHQISMPHQWKKIYA